MNRNNNSNYKMDLNKILKNNYNNNNMNRYKLGNNNYRIKK